MKKIIVITIMCTLFLTACGKDSVAQKIQNDIESIGEVTLDDEYLIEKTYETYNTLTDKQKNQVNNYADLLDARDKLDELKAEAMLSNAIEDQEKEECLSKQRIYYSKIMTSINEDKSVSKSNIDKIIYKYVRENKDTIYDTILVHKVNNTAENTGTWLKYYKGSFYELKQYDENGFNEIQDELNGKSNTYCKKIGENFYANSEDSSISPYSCIFLVDLDDFWNY